MYDLKHPVVNLSISVNFTFSLLIVFESSMQLELQAHLE